MSDINFKNSLPLVTVGIPVYNLPLKIFKVLFNQVLNQTYKNLDILVIDDGSKASCLTTRYIAECFKTDKRIRFIRNEINIGVALTRQRIVKNILGDFFIFIDGDDYIELDFINNMISPLLNSNYGTTISCCAVKTLGDKSKRENRTLIYDSEILEHFFKGRFTTALYNKMLPSKIAKTLVFDESKGQEDVSVMIDIFKQCKLVYRLFDTIYYYRKRRNSLSNSRSKKMAYLTFLSSKYNFECAKTLGVSETTLKRLLAIYKMNEYVLSCIKYQDKNIELHDRNAILSDLNVCLIRDYGIQGGYCVK